MMPWGDEEMKGGGSGGGKEGGGDEGEEGRGISSGWRVIKKYMTTYREWTGHSMLNKIELLCVLTLIVGTCIKLERKHIV